ncbi:hypothetical protein KSP40_PGU021500 [Platanthera guangdongensis]|uniref:HMA domain-containing protein n=1 Tax=Platanthera guangdongensis TaxID=2320717 RepID=A0ABR2N524_9ASPA
MPLLISSRTLKLSPFYLTAQFPPSTSPATAMVSSSAGPFHSRSRDLLSISFSGSFPFLSSVPESSARPMATISSSAALSGSGGGGDGLPGGSGGGGGDGGSSGRDAARKPLVGETEVDPALESDAILLSVGGMTCGGCAASVKRILESQLLRHGFMVGPRKSSQGRGPYTPTYLPRGTEPLWLCNGSTVGPVGRDVEARARSIAERLGLPREMGWGPQVASASVDLEKEIAVVWPVPEAKDAENWQQQLGQKLANHLTTCGFKSILQDKL